jgi:methionyl-tRNA formyltransferase
VKILKSKLALKEDTGRLFARCADAPLEIIELQRAGGKAMGAREFLHGAGPVLIS